MRNHRLTILADEMIAQLTRDKTTTPYTTVLVQLCTHVMRTVSVANRPDVTLNADVIQPPANEIQLFLTRYVQQGCHVLRTLSSGFVLRHASLRQQQTCLLVIGQSD